MADKQRFIYNHSYFKSLGHDIKWVKEKLLDMFDEITIITASCILVV